MSVKKNYTYKFNFVYKTTNIVNGKVYVGKHSTNNLEDGYLGSGKTLNKAIKKYGKENFKREILEFCSDVESVYKREYEIIKELNAVSSDLYYNITDGGEGNKGFIPIFTEDHRRKLSEAQSGREVPKETRNKISKSCKGRKAWNKGKKGGWSEDRIKYMSLINKKRYEEFGYPEESKRKASLKLKGRVSPMKDKKHSDESKVKIKENTKKAFENPELILKLKEGAKKLPIKTCPWCGFEGRSNVIFLHHFDNCKQNPNYTPKPKIEIICPHCDFIGSIKSSMDRWHFDNCSKKKDKEFSV